MTASTVFWTVFAGFSVFVLGQIVVKFVLEPIQEFYKLTGEIGHSLVYYANVYSNTDVSGETERKEAHDKFRGQSCELFAKAYTIPLFRLWSLFRLLPKRDDVEKAGGYLIGLANGCYDKSQFSAERNNKRRVKLD